MFVFYFADSKLCMRDMIKGSATQTLPALLYTHTNTPERRHLKAYKMCSHCVRSCSFISLSAFFFILDWFLVVVVVVVAIQNQLKCVNINLSPCLIYVRFEFFCDDAQLNFFNGEFKFGLRTS